MEFAIGHFLTLNKTHRWQNFFIDSNVNGHSFIPFGFSGISVNRQGDNVDATLVFPNNELSRNWSVEAIENNWLVELEASLLNPESRSVEATLHKYVGIIAQGSWDETSLNLRLNTVLDSVGSDIPARRLVKTLVGNLPTSSSVRLS